MKYYRFFLISALCCALLYSCDNSSNSQNNTPAESAGEVDAPAKKTTTAPVTETTAVPPADTTTAAEDTAVDPNVQQIEIVAEQLKFTPNEIKAEPGKRLQVTLVNNGDVPYSIKFDLPAGEQELREPVEPGRKAALIFTTPEKAGTYAFYSPLTNQRGRGVSGNLIVE